MFRIALLLLFSMPALASAQVVRLPEEVRGGVGHWVIVIPKELDGGIPKWELSAGLEEVDLGGLFGPDIAAKARGKVLRALKPGIYYCIAWNAKGDVASSLSRCKVIIGDPGPDPGPTPVPVPVPVPTPEPTDPFYVGLKEAYGKELNVAQKAAHKTALLSFYRQTGPIVDDKTIDTIGALYAELSKKIRAAVPDDALPQVRAYLVAYMKGQLPTPLATFLDTGLRNKCKAVFANIARGLEALP